MKKIGCFILAMICGAAGLRAQQFYLKAGTGYAFSMPGQTKDQLGNILNGTVSYGSTGADYHLKSASLSSGVHGMAGAGYMFTKNIGVELSADLNLAPHKYTELITGQANTAGVAFDYTATRQAKTTVLFIPALVLQTANRGCNVYMRMGVGLPVNSGIDLYERYLYANGNDNKYTWDIHNYFSLGFNGAAGVTIKLSDDIALYGEASVLYLALSREERELETANLNGRNFDISTLSGIKIYHYNKNGFSDANGNEQTFSQPFSSIGANAGLRFTLSKPAKRSVKG